MEATAYIWKPTRLRVNDLFELDLMQSRASAKPSTKICIICMSAVKHLIPNPSPCDKETPSLIKNYKTSQLMNAGVVRVSECVYRSKTG